MDIDIIGNNIADFIMLKSKPSLNEDMISNIAAYEIKNKRYTESEVRSLAVTLAYGKIYK